LDLFEQNYNFFFKSLDTFQCNFFLFKEYEKILEDAKKEVVKIHIESKNTLDKDIQINIFEVKRPELDAIIVANNIARQLEGKISYRRAIKMAIASTMRMGAEGMKVLISGRLGGAEMARTETYKEGRIPLHTFRADIDYALGRR
jgi:small subunit ribosomal protein S3